MKLFHECTILEYISYNKHPHSIDFKHADISQLLDFVAIRQLRDVCVFEINGMEVFM